MDNIRRRAVYVLYDPEGNIAAISTERSLLTDAMKEARGIGLGASVDKMRIVGYELLERGKGADSCPSPCPMPLFEVGDGNA